MSKKIPIIVHVIVNTGPTPNTAGPGHFTLAVDSEWDNVDLQYVNPVTNPFGTDGM